MLRIFSKGLGSSILSHFVKCACVYNLSASGAVRPQLDIHSIIGNPFLKFLATPWVGVASMAMGICLSKRLKEELVYYR